jgi:hypothetical protein
VAGAILRHHPRDGLTLANMGNAYFRLLKREFLDRYPASFLVPPHLKPRYCFLQERNLAAFSQARGLGWEPDADLTD